MAKKRTKAQRSAAAKEAWRVRKMQAEVDAANLGRANRPTPNKTPLPPSAFVMPAIQPTTAGATREGSELYVTITAGGAVHRFPVSRDTLRKLGLDALQLVG